MINKIENNEEKKKNSYVIHILFAQNGTLYWFDVKWLKIRALWCKNYIKMRLYYYLFANILYTYAHTL